MTKSRALFAALLTCGACSGLLTPAAADFLGGKDNRPESGYSQSHTYEFAAQATRPRITIYPRRYRPGAYAQRYCQSWLAREYRVSGPVIVPQMRCWWN